MIYLIAAKDKHGVIGKDGQMPWHLPNDLKRFKHLTTTGVVVMGRKTYESIGGPLPDRLNIVLTRNKNHDIEEIPGTLHVVHDIQYVLNIDEEVNIFIIGGSQIYHQFMPYATQILITEINEEFNGDTFFPPIDERIWVADRSVKGIKDEKNPYHYKYVTYLRRIPGTEMI